MQLRKKLNYIKISLGAKAYRTWHLLYDICWLKTLYFNFRYFSFGNALTMPVYVYRKTCLKSVKGRISVKCPLKPGLIKLGCRELGTIDIHSDRTVWEADGTLIVNGPAKIGSGSKINIGRNATLELGRGFNITGGTTIICQIGIKTGDNFLCSWECLFLDSDFHHIFDKNGAEINPPAPITIGNNVWIGCRTTVLKGSVIPDGSIVAAGSLITRAFNETDTIIGGRDSNQRVIRHNISWHE